MNLSEARRQLDIHGVVFIHLDGDFLPSAEHVFFSERVGMGQNALLLRAGDEFHAAVGLGNRRQRHPAGRLLRIVQIPVGQVLMPGDDLFRMRLLDEKALPPYQQILAKDLFDSIDDTPVLRQVIDLWQQEMRILVDRIQFRLVSAADLLGG